MFCRKTMLPFGSHQAPLYMLVKSEWSNPLQQTCNKDWGKRTLSFAPRVPFVVPHTRRSAASPLRSNHGQLHLHVGGACAGVPPLSLPQPVVGNPSSWFHHCPSPRNASGSRAATLRWSARIRRRGRATICEEGCTPCACPIPHGVAGMWDRGVVVWGRGQLCIAHYIFSWHVLA